MDFFSWLYQYHLLITNLNFLLLLEIIITNLQINNTVMYLLKENLLSFFFWNYWIYYHKDFVDGVVLFLSRGVLFVQHGTVLFLSRAVLFVQRYLLLFFRYLLFSSQLLLFPRQLLLLSSQLLLYLRQLLLLSPQLLLFVRRLSFFLLLRVVNLDIFELNKFNFTFTAETTSRWVVIFVLHTISNHYSVNSILLLWF